MRCNRMFVFLGKSGQPPVEARCRLEAGHGKVHEARKPKGGIVKWRHDPNREGKS